MFNKRRISYHTNVEKSIKTERDILRKKLKNFYICSNTAFNARATESTQTLTRVRTRVIVYFERNRGMHYKEYEENIKITISHVSIRYAI
jgi:hypothetical protein